MRPEDEFALGHLPEALHVPFAELKRHLGDPEGRELIARTACFNREFAPINARNDRRCPRPLIALLTAALSQT